MSITEAVIAIKISGIEHTGLSRTVKYCNQMIANGHQPFIGHQRQRQHYVVGKPETLDVLMDEGRQTVH